MFKNFFKGETEEESLDRIAEEIIEHISHNTIEQQSIIIHKAKDKLLHKRESEYEETSKKLEMLRAEIGSLSQ